MAPKRSALLAVVAAALLSSGCDEVVLYDVAPSGHLLVAADAEGRCAISGKDLPRHLFSVDPVTGKAKRLTAKARRLTWPTTCGKDALFVDRKTRLVHLSATGSERAVHRIKTGRLLQPLTSPQRRHVAILEASRLGVPGTLVVLELATGRVVHRLERVLPGGLWTPAGLIVPRAAAGRGQTIATGAGEILRLDRQFKATVVFRGSLPALTALSSAGKTAVVAALHTTGSAGPLALARLDVRRRNARRGARGHFDFWPTCEPGGERLLFTRSTSKRRSLQGELRLTSLDLPATSTVLPTHGAKVSAPRWIGPRRIAYVTAADHLVLQDLDGKHRLDLTRTLRAGFGAAKN